MFCLFLLNFQYRLQLLAYFKLYFSRKFGSLLREASSSKGKLNKSFLLVRRNAAALVSSGFRGVIAFPLVHFALLQACWS